MRKTEVYSWRVSSNLKSALEEAARDEQTSVGTLLDRIADEWLHGRAARAGSDDEEQARLHAAVKPFVGAIRGGDSDRASQVSARVKAKLAQRYGR